MAEIPRSLGQYVIVVVDVSSRFRRPMMLGQLAVVPAFECIVEPVCQRKDVRLERWATSGYDGGCKQ